MSERFSEDEALARVAALTRARLVAFREAELVRPVNAGSGPLYRRVDVARMELMCDLCETFDLEDDTLALVMSLLDQLHAVRRERQALLEAIEKDGSRKLRMAAGEALRAIGRG